MQVYIAPSKALVQEKLRDWSQKFGSWGINCLELTGDNEFYNIKSIQDSDLILTTPEVSIQMQVTDKHYKGQMVYRDILYTLETSVYRARWRLISSKEIIFTLNCFCFKNTCGQSPLFAPSS